jgi:hypothetical protein
MNILYSFVGPWVAYWHRSHEGNLVRGTLRSWPIPCKAKFDIYTPNDLAACPQVLVICSNIHSHPPPAPVKTPEAFRVIFYKLLLTLSWKLADATPRRILLDSAFIQALRAQLDWKESRNPTLSDLHPSLGNSDHARRLINSLRFDEFPSGTGFEGAIHLATKHDLLPVNERYVRCAETHQLPTQSVSSTSSLHLVICMTQQMSWRLMQAKRLSIDTSFKRVHGWQEFEFESWDIAHMKCELFEIVRASSLMTMTVYCSCYWCSSIHNLSISTSTFHPLSTNIRDC